MPTAQQELSIFLDETFIGFNYLIDQHQPMLVEQEYGVVTYVGHGIVRGSWAARCTP